jgi:hypothetical protein
MLNISSIQRQDVFNVGRNGALCFGSFFAGMSAIDIIFAQLRIRVSKRRIIYEIVSRIAAHVAISAAVEKVLPCRSIARDKIAMLAIPSFLAAVWSWQKKSPLKLGGSFFILLGALSGHNRRVALAVELVAIIAIGLKIYFDLVKKERDRGPSLEELYDQSRQQQHRH